MKQTLTGKSMVNSVLQKANARPKFLYRKQKKFTLNTIKASVHVHYTVPFLLRLLLLVCGIIQNIEVKKKKKQTNKMVTFVSKMDPRSHMGLMNLSPLVAY